MTIDEPTHVPYREYEDVVDKPEDDPQERPARGRDGQSGGQTVTPPTASVLPTLEVDSSTPVSLGQLHQLLDSFQSSFTKSLLSQLKDGAATSKVAQREKTPHPKKGKGKAASAPKAKVNWKQVSEAAKEPHVQRAPRREIVIQQPTQSFLDARDYLRAKKAAAKAQAEVSDTASTPLMSDSLFVLSSHHQSVAGQQFHPLNHGHIVPYQPNGQPEPHGQTEPNGQPQPNGQATLHGQNHAHGQAQHFGPHDPQPHINQYVPLEQKQPVFQVPHVPHQAQTNFFGQTYQAPHQQLNQLSLAYKTPFSAEIMSAPQVGKVKGLNIDAYDGTTDPDDHLAAYKHLMYLQGVDDATWCKYFPATLKGVAQKWFNSLPDQSIRNFTELSMIFTHHFMANK